MQQNITEKKNTISFSPELPRRTRHAINTLGMGVLNKVALEFPKIFWPRDREFLEYLSGNTNEFQGFLNVAYYTQTPHLLGFAGGALARAVEEKSDSAVQALVMKTLRAMFGRTVPNPTRIAVTRWGKDPHSYGSYSHNPVGASSTHYETLSQPIKKRLFFAGEATIREYRGTVHGAFLSGIREAERVHKIAKG